MQFINLLWMQIMSENCHFSVEWSSTANQYLKKHVISTVISKLWGIRHFEIFKNMNGI